MNLVKSRGGMPECFWFVLLCVTTAAVVLALVVSSTWMLVLGSEDIVSIALVILGVFLAPGYACLS